MSRHIEVQSFWAWPLSLLLDPLFAPFEVEKCPPQDYVGRHRMGTFLGFDVPKAGQSSVVWLQARLDVELLLADPPQWFDMQLQGLLALGRLNRAD